MNSNKEFPKRIIVALGGNAIHPAGIKGTSEEQVAIAEETADVLLPLLELENELIITHGNGLGVGKVLMRQALAHKQVAPMSLDICDISLVESLSSSGTIVIAGRGGGVPVVRNCQGL